MSAGEATADRQVRREQLLDAADRVVQRDGPDASMTAIAAEAGITKPILYRWFGDKQGLYAALAERHVGHLLDLLLAELRGPADRRARTRSLVGTYLRYVETTPQVYRFLMYRAVEEEPSVRSQVADFLRRLGDELATGLCLEFELPPDDPGMHAWGAAIVGAVQSAVDRWLQLRDVSGEALVEQLTRLLCDGWVGGAGP
ncbi:MAG: TetR family transcriptional regulator [Mycobacteriales bacterium]